MIPWFTSNCKVAVFAEIADPVEVPHDEHALETEHLQSEGVIRDCVVERR
jgi:hypothetical protein